MAVLTAKIFCDGFGSRLDMKLLVNVPEVGAYGVNANVELVGDLFVS